ncbi:MULTISPECIES: hypothetical protein [Aerosakkonema]|uniref:hypothetical protein n=1 Tax=Aerosakkonema TaxID=1246629 RepID=UPI0035B96A86
MSIKEECELLQSLLGQAISLIAEAKSSADGLEDCGLSEMDGQISSILDICSEGMNCLKQSQEKIELIQGMFGDQTFSATASKNENLANSQLEKTIQDLQKSIDEVQSWVRGSLKQAVQTGKNFQTTLMMVTMLYGGLITKGMEDFVEPIKEISNSVVAPLTSKKSGFSIIKETENKMHEKLGIDSEFQKLDTSREPDKKRRKRESEISGEVSNQPGSSGKK